MNKNNLIMYAAIAGGAYALYWYITHYGPNGAALDANGNKLGVSYWDSWFGSTPQVATGTPAPAPTTTTTVTTTTPGTPVTTTQAPALASASQISQIKSLLKPSDQAAFSAMIPTLTADKAASMLANAAACSSGEIGADGSCVSQSALATKLQSLAGSNSQSVSQWNWYVTNRLDPNAQIITTSTAAGTNPISAQTYVDLRQSMGIADPNLTAAVSVQATPVDVPPQQPLGTPQSNPIAWVQYAQALQAYSAAHPGMSGIIATPSVQTQPGMAQMQPAKRNPWGRLPVAGGYVN